MSYPDVAVSEIRGLFTDEIEIRSGQVTDTFDDGRRLFARATLPQIDEARPRDRMQGGVALKATAEKICVYPYVFREVCRNGAIMAHALESHRIVTADHDTPEEVVQATREAVEVCCREEVFEKSMTEIRSTIDMHFDMSIMLLQHLSQLSPKLAERIVEQFFADGDPSGFGMMNAITSVARDNPDPEQRWRLEELGGGIAARLMPKSPTDSGRVSYEGRDAVGSF